MANSADPDQLADLDLDCLQRQGIARLSMTRVKKGFISRKAFLLEWFPFEKGWQILSTWSSLSLSLWYLFTINDLVHRSQAPKLTGKPQ